MRLQGKHLVGIFKEARSAYREKKEALRQERSPSFRRAQTFNVPRSGAYHGPIVEEYEDGQGYNEYEDDYHRSNRPLGPGAVPLYLENGRRRHSLDDEDRRSHYSTSSRHRHRSHRGIVGRDGASVSGHSERQPSQPPLTMSNLRTLSEISATRPSELPAARRRLSEPYTEATPRGVALSRQVLDKPVRSLQADSSMVHRPQSGPYTNRHTGDGGSGGDSASLSKPVDMDLAYGDIPPDLGLRVDLDPVVCCDDDTDSQQESQVETLVDRIEALLNEAQCLHHTAASIICHLQDHPEAAAAVALTLAELSALLSKLSPAFLGAVKGGSPAVFALLASPQFLIGTSIAVGVTVILFGGWKIVKRISEVRTAREDAKLAFESADQAKAQQQPNMGSGPVPALAASNAPALCPEAYDEALVLEEELSTIESWRRGIEYDVDACTEPWVGSEADIELISPEAMRSRVGDDDQRTLRSTRTTKYNDDMSIRSGRSRRRSKHHGSSTQRDEGVGNDKALIKIPLRLSSSKDHQSEEANKSQGRHRRHGDDSGSDAGSTHSRRSNRHSSSGRAHRGTSIAPDDGDEGRSATRYQAAASEAGDSGTRESKKANGSGSMLKQLFKKKRDKEDKARVDVAPLALT